MPIALRYSSLERKRVSRERARSAGARGDGIPAVDWIPDVDWIPACAGMTALSATLRAVT
jgi:hypothetical protein